MRQFLMMTAVPAMGLAFALGAAVPALADQQPSAQPGQKLVNAAATLRSLTQSVAADNCQIARGFRPEEARQDLGTVTDEINAIITLLRDGDPQRNIPAADVNARLVTALDDVTAQWEPMGAAATRLAADGANAADLDVIETGYVPLYEGTQHLAAMFSGVHSDPSFLKRDATVLKFAIRQRSLAYQMARQICELAYTPDAAAKREELRATVGLFDQTLLALRDGMPAAGVSAPPNDAVLESIVAAYAIWTDGRGIFDAALAGQVPQTDDVAAAGTLSRQLSKAMRDAIDLYMVAAAG